MSSTAVVATWPSAADLAGLRGLPGTDRGVRKRALAEGWAFDTVPVRGGLQVRYDPAGLPAQVRLALAERQATQTGHLPVQQIPPLPLHEARIANIAKAPARPLSVDEANRTRVLVLFQRWWSAIGGNLHPAFAHFCLLWNGKAVEASDELRHAFPKLNASTLRSWWMTMQERGSLARDAHPRAGKYSALSGEVGTAVLAVMATRPHLSATQVRKLLIKHGMLPVDQIPSERAFQRAFKAFKTDNAQGWLAHINPDAHRSRYMAASGDAAAHIHRPNEEWQMDSTVGDVMLVDPETGEVRRHHIIAVIDVFTRRAMFLVTRVSRANAITALIRKAISAWGKPERIKTDNGQDYTAELLEFALRQLDIGHPLCTPFQPQEKPYVERVFGTLLHSLFPHLTGFIGHSVAQRKAIESVRSFADRLLGKAAEGRSVELRLSPQQLQTMIDNWTADYLDEEHSTLGTSPNAHTEANLRHIQRIDERALHLFLQPIALDDSRKVTKKGLAVDKGTFTAPELGGLEGTFVRCRMSEDELGQLYVFDLAGAFICVAVDETRLGVNLREVSAKRKAVQKAINSQFKDVLKHASRAYDTDKAVRDVYLDREQAAIEKSEGKVTRLPPRESLVSTPAIDSIITGIENRMAAKAPQIPANQAAAVEAAMQRLESPAPVAQLFRVADSQDERYSAFLRMQARIQQGQAITPAERTWFEGYGTTAERRTMDRLNEGTDPLAAKGGGEC